LSLIGLWCTDEINACYGQAMLPPSHVLSFFYEAVEQRGWGYDPAYKEFWRVIPADGAVAVAVTAPDGVEHFPSWSLSSRRVLTVPDLWDPALSDLAAQDGDGVQHAYERLDAGDPAPRHRAFGWPEPVQNAMPLECQLTCNGSYVGGPEGYRDPRVAELKDGVADWILLWQIDTDEEAGWMWGDVGTIYYWIRRQDLPAASTLHG
jgi:hypothetical protein